FYLCESVSIRVPTCFAKLGLVSLLGGSKTVGRPQEFGDSSRRDGSRESRPSRLKPASRQPHPPSGQMNDPALDGRRRGLRAILHAQLTQYALHVILHGMLRDTERICDLLIRQPADNQLEHLHFARAQV